MPVNPSFLTRNNVILLSRTVKRSRLDLHETIIRNSKHGDLRHAISSSCVGPLIDIWRFGIFDRRAEGVAGRELSDRLVVPAFSQILKPVQQLLI
jgi:hypothetical protein